MSHSKEMAKGIQDLRKVSMLIRHVYMPLEQENENIKSVLSNFVKSTVDTIDQVSGSRAIELPSYIEPDEEAALNSRSAIEEYEFYLVRFQKIYKLFLF